MRKRLCTYPSLSTVDAASCGQAEARHSQIRQVQRMTFTNAPGRALGIHKCVCDVREASSGSNGLCATDSGVYVTFRKHFRCLFILWLFDTRSADKKHFQREKIIQHSLTLFLKETLVHAYSCSSFGEYATCKTTDGPQTSLFGITRPLQKKACASPILKMFSTRRVSSN